MSEARDVLEELEISQGAKPSYESEDYVADVFGQDGVLARAFQGYVIRQGQLELAYAAADAMEQGGRLMVEAPVATGKSLGYGVPATYHAAKGERVVIVTANIALQEQLIGKDLPTLARLLPWEFSFAIAKGVNNYLCHLAFEDSVDDVLLGKIKFTADEKAKWRVVEDWAGSTEFGDVSELPFEPKRLLTMFTTTSDDCLGRKCSHYEKCHSVRARRRVSTADVIVTNYHLFFTDLVLKTGNPDSPAVLPVYAHVVFDEAHKAVGIAQDYLGFRISRGSIEWGARMLNSPHGKESKKGAMPILDEKLHGEIVAKTEQVFERALEHVDSRDYDVRMRRGGEIDGLTELAVLLERAVAVYGERSPVELGVSSERSEEIVKAAARCRVLSSQLNAFDKLVDARARVYFLEKAGQGVVLKSKVVDVAPWLAENFFDLPTPKSVVLTSATLRTGENDFSYVKKTLGLTTGEVEAFDVESPLDIANQAVFIVPRGMPEPNSNEFADAVADAFVRVVGDARGGVLGLFTSYRVLTRVHERLTREFEGVYRILRHGEAPRTKLIQTFKEDVDSVLLGTESFWAGVDVPGRACRVVMIDRLPFPNLSDPVENLLKQRHSDYFFRHSLPKAFLQLSQGVGRLIRSESDRGVVICLDRRITDKPYGQKFKRVMPKGTPMKNRLEAVKEFLDE